MLLKGRLALLMVLLESKFYGEYLTTEKNGQAILFVKLQKLPICFIEYCASVLQGFVNGIRKIWVKT